MADPPHSDEGSGCSSARMQLFAVGQALCIYMISEWLLVSVIEFELSRYPAFSVFCQQLFIVAIVGVAVLARFVSVQFYDWGIIFQIAVLALLICFSILLRGQREFNQFLWMIEFASRALLTVVFVFFLTNKCVTVYKLFTITIFSMGIGLTMSVPPTGRRLRPRSSSSCSSPIPHPITPEPAQRSTPPRAQPEPAAL